MVWLAPCLCQFPAPQGCHIGSHVKSLIDEGEAGIKGSRSWGTASSSYGSSVGRLAETTVREADVLPMSVVRAAAKATCDPILKEIMEGSYGKLSHEVSMYVLSHEDLAQQLWKT